MNKSRLVFGFRSIISFVTFFSLLSFLAMGAWAASTIGTNMSTTGTYTVTPASDSATSVRFQNAAGTNYFIANSTNMWVGIGAAPQTTFEVQGTSSASYFLTGNTLQVAGYASVAYSRFGTAATNRSAFVTTTNDLLISGDLEVDAKAFFDTTASVGGDFEAVGIASATTGFFTANMVSGHNVASSSVVYDGEFGGGAGTATVSLLFGSSSASSKGTCLQLKNTAGNWVYLRIEGTSSISLEINTIKCHQ